MRTAELPAITPMLAQIGKGSPPVGEDWLYEIKWDGVRAICSIQNGQLKLTSRNGNAMERQYPELAILPEQVRLARRFWTGRLPRWTSAGCRVSNCCSNASM